MDKYQIPRYIDEPTKIILWTVDEFILFIVPFLVLMLCFDSVITGILIGALLVYGLKKIKGEQGHYFLYNLMYWYLPSLIKFKKTPPSYIRELIS